MEGDTDREARLEEIRRFYRSRLSDRFLSHAPEDIDWLLSEIDRLREIEEAAQEVLRHEDTASDHGPGDRAYIDSYRAAFEDLRRALHEGDEDGD